MRIGAAFKAKKFPLSRKGVLSIIKEALSESSNDYKKALFEKKNSLKPFSYAIYLKNFSINEDIINLDGFEITISSGDPEFMFHFYNGIRSFKEYKYQDFIWTLEKVRMLQEKTITSSQVLFKTVSPILIETKDGKPLSPDDSEYEKEFNYYANLVMKECINRPLKSPLKVRPMNMKKVVVKESNIASREIEGKDKTLYFTTYKGYLYLEGDPEDLNYLYQYGVSKRRSFGFGLLDIEMEGVR